MLLIEWDERQVGTCKMTNADISGNRKGNKAQRHCQIGKFNDSEIISNREISGYDQVLGSSECQLTVSEQCHKSTSFKENR